MKLMRAASREREREESSLFGGWIPANGIPLNLWLSFSYANKNDLDLARLHLFLCFCFAADSLRISKGQHHGFTLTFGAASSFAGILFGTGVLGHKREAVDFFGFCLETNHSG